MTHPSRKQFLLSQPSGKDPRLAALAALHASQRGELFIAEFLDQWAERTHPNPKDLALAQTLARGACRKRQSLRTIASHASSSERLKLKSLDLLLLDCALYQKFYLDRIPEYAILSETMRLAKQLSSLPSSRFIRAILTHASLDSLPTDSSPESLAKSYSYPLWFVEKLLQEKREGEIQELLEVQNQPYRPMVRLRSAEGETRGWPSLPESSLPMSWLPEGVSPKTAVSLGETLQNVTPATLLHHLLPPSLPRGSSLLDLCAAPGGKSLLIHDLRPDLQLTLSDRPQRLPRLRDNLLHYGVEASLLTGPAENLTPSPTFDAVLVDAPCSNSGALAKQVEARWRLGPDTLASHIQEQQALLTQAIAFLRPGGWLLYSTCSILRAENEEMTQWILTQFPEMECAWEENILPTSWGAEGGYGVRLHKKEQKGISPSPGDQ